MRVAPSSGPCSGLSKPARGPRVSDPAEMGKGGIALSIFLSLFFLVGCGPIFFVLFFIVFAIVTLGPVAVVADVPEWLVWLPATLAAVATLLVSFIFGPSAVLGAKEKMLIRRAEVKRAREDLADRGHQRSPNPDGERLREELRREREARKHRRD